MIKSRRRPALARRLPALVGLVVLLATMLAEPAMAASVKRTWTAHLGSNGVNGTAVLRAYSTGTGALDLKLTGLLPSTTNPVIVYRGTCASPQVIARVGQAVTNAGGAATRTTAISLGTMSAIWIKARSGPIAIKIGSGTSGRCAALTFPLATRIAIPSLAIDLPVVRGPSGYPYCNVAMYYPSLAQPREAGVSFIYGHARAGMFLPLLQRSKVNNGASLVGKTIEVWTSDDVLSTYRITRVRRHVTSFGGAFGSTSEQLWIQTSEGPHGTIPKLIVVAARISSAPSTHAAANPAPRPVICH